MKRNRLSLLFVAGLLSAGSAFQGAAAKGKAADGHDHAHGTGGGHGDAVGVAGQPGKVGRTVTVDMTDDMRFHPSSASVKQGETVRFVVKNSGRLKHEFVLGTEKELKEHYEVMKRFPEMEHADPNMVSVAPGKRGEVLWQFTRSGKVDFACLQPGHYDAGMKGVVAVAAVKGQAGKDGQDRGNPPPAAAQLAQALPGAPSGEAMADGEVRKVDLANRKLTLKHGEIRNLDMPGMTMVFQVKDASMLDRLKAGDKVRFSVEKLNGAFTVTSIEVVK